MEFTVGGFLNMLPKTLGVGVGRDMNVQYCGMPARMDSQTSLLAVWRHLVEVQELAKIGMRLEWCESASCILPDADFSFHWICSSVGVSYYLLATVRVICPQLF